MRCGRRRDSKTAEFRQQIRGKKCCFLGNLCPCGLDKIAGMNIKCLPQPASTTVDATTQGMPPAKTNLVLKCDYRDGDFLYWPRPSELELAGLAAQLALSSKANPKQLVSQAWALYWESCRVIQSDYRKVEALLALENQEEQAFPGDAKPEEDSLQIPTPNKFPVSFARVELLLLPELKGRTADRARVFREHILSVLLQGCFVVRPKLREVSYWELEPETLEEMRQKFHSDIADRFGKLRKHDFEEAEYLRFARSFLEWHRQYKSAKKSAAARRRWHKVKIQETNGAGSDGLKISAKN
jgi:hypothetical protein